MYLLLSPAKNLNESDAPPPHMPSTPVLLAQAQILADRLRQLNASDLQKLMKLSPKLAALNVDRYCAWQNSNHTQGKAAVYLFAGDAYQGLNAYELLPNEMAYLNEHLGILSGLYGLLKPLDVILPYRLEMGTKLAIGQHANLYQFWGNRISDLLNARLKEHASRCVINLASNEYFKAINTQHLHAPVITPIFLDKKNGDYKIISFYAKRARGLMTRFCAVNQLTRPDELKDFDMEHYYFSPKRSDASTWVFLRDRPY